LKNPHPLHRVVSVLILNYNGRHHLESCLSSVLNTGYPDLEVLMIDNGSKDDSIEFVGKNFPSVRIVKNSENLGFARGYNSGVEESRGEYLFFLNNDVEIDRNCISHLLKRIQREDVACVSPKMKLYYDRGRINAAGGACDIYGIGWNRGNGELDIGQYDREEEVFYAIGGAMMMKRRVWRVVGSFDERYFAYAEDLDWCWRARLLGYAIVYVPDAIIYHKWRSSFTKRDEMIFLTEKHWLSNLMSNYRSRTLTNIMPKYLALRLLKLLWIAREGTAQELIAMIKALLWNLTNLRSTIKKRRFIQAIRKVDDKQIQKVMLSSSFELMLLFKKLHHWILSEHSQENPQQISI
jgi:GT2 family glycosyltransferase